MISFACLCTHDTQYHAPLQLARLNYSPYHPTTQRDLRARALPNWVYPMLEFHKSQVENGGQIVSKNIETIIALLKAVGGQLDLNRTARQTQA